MSLDTSAPLNEGTPGDASGGMDADSEELCLSANPRSGDSDVKIVMHQGSMFGAANVMALKFKLAPAPQSSSASARDMSPTRHGAGPGVWPRLAQRRLHHGDTLLWGRRIQFKFGMLDLTTLRLD
jgi:hypothetical protein